VPRLFCMKVVLGCKVTFPWRDLWAWLSVVPWRPVPRFHSDMPRHPCLAGKRIDFLFLDNTFQSPLYDDFPLFGDAVLEAVALIQSHPRVNIVFAMDLLGKEAFCMAVGLVRRFCSLCPHQITCGHTWVLNTLSVRPPIRRVASRLCWNLTNTRHWNCLAIDV